MSDLIPPDDKLDNPERPNSAEGGQLATNCGSQSHYDSDLCGRLTSLNFYNDALSAAHRLSKLALRQPLGQTTLFNCSPNITRGQNNQGVRWVNLFGLKLNPFIQTGNRYFGVAKRNFKKLFPSPNSKRSQGFVGPPFKLNIVISFNLKPDLKSPRHSGGGIDSLHSFGGTMRPANFYKARHTVIGQKIDVSHA